MWDSGVQEPPAIVYRKFKDRKIGISFHSILSGVCDLRSNLRNVYAVFRASKTSSIPSSDIEPTVLSLPTQFSQKFLNSFHQQGSSRPTGERRIVLVSPRPSSS